MVICTDDPAESAARYARFTGRRTGKARASPSTAAGSTSRPPPELALILPAARPPGLPFIAAVVLKSADVAATRRFMEAAGVPVETLPDGVIAVAPEFAMGAWMVVHAAGVAWPQVPDAP